MNVLVQAEVKAPRRPKVPTDQVVLSSIPRLLLTFLL